MTEQLLAALALALAAAAPAVGAQSFAYKPGAQRFRLDQTIAQTQEMQGQKMDMNLTSAQFISLAAAAQGANLGLTYTVDSVRFETPTGSAAAMAGPVVEQQAAQAKALAGKQVVATISPLGEVSSLAAADSADAVGKALALGFRSFLVAFPSADVKAGMTWTDTTKSSMNNMGLDITTTAIMTYTVAGDTTVHGRKAWKVAQQGTMTLSGMGNSQGADLVMSGGGTINGLAFVGQDGVYLGGQSEQLQNMTLEVPAASMSVPMTNKITTKIVPVQ